MQIQAHKTLFNILRNNKSNNITKTKHAWTLQEEQICVQLYIDLYIKNKSSTEINDFLKALGESCPNIYIGSLKMKIQNIKQLCIELNIEDTLKISPLSKYSKTCKSVFINLLKQNNIVKG